MQAYLGLGSNLDDPLAQLQKAVDALRHLSHVRVLRCSPVYRNPALTLPGQSAQPDFFNAVIAVETNLPPLDLLTACQRIEQAQGRVRAERWGARTLDIDLLLYGNETIALPQLQVPHPGLPVRAFALQPLMDLMPTLALPDGTPLCELLARCSPSSLVLAGNLT